MNVDNLKTVKECDQCIDSLRKRGIEVPAELHSR